MNGSPVGEGFFTASGSGELGKVNGFCAGNALLWRPLAGSLRDRMRAGPVPAGVACVDVLYVSRKRDRRRP